VQSPLHGSPARGRRLLLAGLALSVGLLTSSVVAVAAQSQPEPVLWRVYRQSLAKAKYVDLTHTITPTIPVWAGFAKSKFSPAVDPKTGKAWSYATDGFEATHYDLGTDQLGTQLDPPAHWNPDYPAIDELPATFAVRPLVVIPIQDKVARDPGYHLTVDDVLAWETRHGRIPAGSVVFIRSDWSRSWPDPALATKTPIPGVKLEALKFLHEQRHILFHGHEPLDADSTPTMESERWLLTHGYTQAEAVAHLDQVPEAGALVAIGFPKFKGGTGGYARFIAICPPDWKYGVSIGQIAEAPLARQRNPLRWDADAGTRVR
jgi:kynurenine formamidase